MKLKDKRFLRWSSLVPFLVVLALLPGTAMAQDALMLIGGATVFEGNSGTKNMFSSDAADQETGCQRHAQ